MIVVDFHVFRQSRCCLYQRLINLPELLKKKSHFLFGPRSVGKSTLIAASLENALIFDLLDEETYRNLLRSPKLIGESITAEKRIVVIDEVQRIPELLNEVQRLIVQKKAIFLLTGSSARKLRHGAANLLGGRAWEMHLYPLCWKELDNFDLLRFVNQGGIPDFYLSELPKRELSNYVSLYLQQEIKAEALTRNVQSFAEFLDFVGSANGQEINYENFASDCQVSVSTIKNYFQILEDTLIGFRVPGYTKTTKRRATSRAKHYLFDLGVAHSLAKIQIESLDSINFGPAFEHFIALELRAYLRYTEKETQLRYWRSSNRFEVDFVLGDTVAIEVKSTKSANENHSLGLRVLKEENIFSRFIMVTRDLHKRVTAEGIEIYPYEEFLSELWDGRILT